MSRELDEQCARALGYTTVWADGGFGEALYLHDPGARRISEGVTENCHLLGGRWERMRINGDIVEMFARLCPAFSTDYYAARLLEDEIERRGLRFEYMNVLLNELGCMPLDPNENAAGDIWSLIRATPEQRAQAFLKAVENA